MRYLLMMLFLFSSSSVFGQRGTDSITFSNFNKPHDVALLDTVKQTLVWNNYKNFISDEKTVFSKRDKAKDFSSISKLLKKLSSNGTDDISKCFYPHHSINYYKEGKIVKYVLICFECEGVRFSDERWITKVKNEQKRMAMMKELKAYFVSQDL